MKPAAILLSLALPAAALDTLDIPSIGGSKIATPEDGKIRREGQDLLRRPGAADALARRILSSRLGEALPEGDSSRRTLLDWIARKPEDAARLALGFAQDDARGNDAFERSLYERIKRRFELNPDRYNGLLGRLSLTAEESEKISGLRSLSGGERHKLLKRFFEGRSSGEGALSGPPGAQVAAASLYDRLGSMNLTGYSPQIQALQSEMNRHGAPGAPRLIETGRLDYATLHHPYFGLRFDVDALKRRLTEQAGLAEPDARLRREEALARAESALAAFALEAEKTRTASGLTPARLNRLAKLRGDAARWIAYAAQEERAARLLFMRGVVTEELRSLVAKTPVSRENKAAFLDYGRRLERRFQKAGDDAVAAAGLLAPAAESPEAESRLRADKEFNATRLLLGELSGMRARYLAAAARAAACPSPPSTARGLLDRWAARFFPGTDYAEEARRRGRAREEALAAFLGFARSKP